MVKIITDSAADFEHSESEKFGISTIPLAVYIDGKEYKDDFLHSKERFTGLQSCRKLFAENLSTLAVCLRMCFKKRREITANRLW